ncbi:MAG TPA: HD domain-containing phosphohydrolase [Clostridia bacterium]
MPVYITKEDIITEDGILLLRKDQRVNDTVLSKLQRFHSSIIIDFENYEIYNGLKLKNYNKIQKTSGIKIIQSFSARKHIFNERILEKPNKVLSNLIFESKSEPWWIYINALINHVSWLYIHSIDVAMMSLIMAVESGYGNSQLFNIGLGALLHDIGMLLLPKSIIERPLESLNETEQLIFCQHCELGKSSLESYNLPNECTDIILQHHERLDGSGYPKGLKGDEICLNSRMVMIADAVDAITSDCPDSESVYQLDEAIEIIKNEDKFSNELICLLEKILQ